MDLQVKKKGSVYWRIIPRSYEKAKEVGSRGKEVSGEKARAF